MRIVLIYPYFLEERIHAQEISVPPMGIYYVGAMLKAHGCDVEILNWHAVHKTAHVIEETLEKVKPDIIGFSILHANRWGGIDIARMVKKVHPDAAVVFGGVGATFLWEHFLTHFAEIDYVVLGEGEHTFLDLVSQLERGNRQSIGSIAGLAYRKNGRAVRNAERPLIEHLDDLPDPALYFAYPHLSLTRGCAGNCNFCGSPRFWGRHVRFHSAEYFVRQIQQLYQKGIHFFYISDDTFTASRKRVIEVCKLIIEAGLDTALLEMMRTVSGKLKGLAEEIQHDADFFD